MHSTRKAFFTGICPFRFDSTYCMTLLSSMVWIPVPSVYGVFFTCLTSLTPALKGYDFQGRLMYKAIPPTPRASTLPSSVAKRRAASFSSPLVPIRSSLTCLPSNTISTTLSRLRCPRLTLTAFLFSSFLPEVQKVNYQS